MYRYSRGHVGVIMGKEVLCLSIRKEYSVVRINAVKIYLFTVKIYIRQTTWQAVLAKTITPNLYTHITAYILVCTVLNVCLKISSLAPILWIYRVFFFYNLRRNALLLRNSRIIRYIIIFTMCVETWNYTLDVYLSISVVVKILL